MAAPTSAPRSFPRPEFYGGAIGLNVTALDFRDGEGRKIPPLADASITDRIVAPFLLYVPNVEVLGGALGFVGVFPAGEECGRLFAPTAKLCRHGVGDPYVEAVWSRYFGTPRLSKYPNSFPIAGGLTVAAGFGALLPVGQYNALEAANRGVTIGNNIWDFAPSLAVTYITKPIIADGTEFSAKLYWNNYLKNPTTQYSTGSLLDLDFAVTEKIGRIQVGFTGFYVAQVADDRLFGVPIAPDGRRLEVLNFGGVLAYDMPEYGAAAKVKVLTTLIARNAPASPGVAISFIKKLY